MVFFDHAHRLLDRFRISSRIRGLSFRPDPQWRGWRWIFALTLFAASGLAALLANDWAASEARRAWESEHAPSLRLWRHLVTSHGFTLTQDERKSAPALRSLPVSDGLSHSIWVDNAYRAIILDLKGSETPLYARAGLPRGQTGDWKRFGTGWDAFEELDEALKKAPLQTQKAKKKRTWNDPRAFTY